MSSRNYQLGQQDSHGDEPATWTLHMTVWGEPDSSGVPHANTDVIGRGLSLAEALDHILLAEAVESEPHNPSVGNSTGFDIQVRDQDEQPVKLTGAYRGYKAAVVHVEVDKPQPPLSAQNATMALAAAMLGMNLARDVRAIGVDIEDELDRMGYGLIQKQPRRT